MMHVGRDTLINTHMEPAKHERNQAKCGLVGEYISQPWWL